AYSNTKSYSTDAPSRIRDFAIVAHVDHGKTTLMDKLLSQCNQNVSTERIMDNNALEKERGITISSKYTCFKWKEHTFNAVDTPGHADFGGEVERVLSMVDGCVLLCDAMEGPLAQTKFVVSKALAKGLQPLIVLNKVDRPAVTEEQCLSVESDLFDLFANLGATDQQLDFKVLYASAREGIATYSFDRTRALLAQKEAGNPGPLEEAGMNDLLDAIMEHVPSPQGVCLQLLIPRRDPADHFRMLVTMIERDAFMGRLVTGRVMSGTAKVGDHIKSLSRTGELKEDSKVTKIFTRQAMSKVPCATPLPTE
ncbi:hypothetical protein CYMTET_30834, partial [Cymbomonas tetramitiformis]